jgi:pyruvate/2-oxoglutarate dehydrogenase complex dihydrolipoamide dehydrogenase (E3) component
MEGSLTVNADLLVIGGGAAGMAAARTAASMHRRVALVQDGPVGGDCTFTGCVPSKTLIEAAHGGLPFADAMHRVRDTVKTIAATETADVLRGEGITVLEGRARFTRPNTVTINGRQITGRRVVIATGSRPSIPPIPGLDQLGPLTSDTVWNLDQAPTSLAVIGGGATGCELAQAFARFGVPVTLIESGRRLLSVEEPDASAVIADAFKRDGIDLRLGVTVTAATRGGEGGMRLTLDDGSSLQTAAVLVATGRDPATETLDLDAAGVVRDDRGHVVVDEHMRTNLSGVYAAGDVTGRLPFTHAADEMGRLAAINALRWPLRLRFHAESVPWVTFTDPEVARVGMTEEDAADHDGRVAHLPLSAVDRAVTAGATDGFITLVAGPRRLTRHLAGGRLLGATIVAPRAGELIHEAALVMRLDAFTGRLAQTVHAYPTWATGIRQAAAQFLFEIDGRRARPARRPD